MDKWKPHGPNWAKTPHVSCWAVLTYGRTGDISNHGPLPPVSVHAFRRE